MQYSEFSVLIEKFMTWVGDEITHVQISLDKYFEDSLVQIEVERVKVMPDVQKV